jgi:hypothetical protein
MDAEASTTAACNSLLMVLPLCPLCLPTEVDDINDTLAALPHRQHCHTSFGITLLSRRFVVSDSYLGTMKILQILNLK